MVHIAQVFEIQPLGAFDLRRAAGFGFGPRAGAREPAEPVMRLAFCVDGFREQAGVVLRQGPDGTIQGEVHGTDDVEAVRRQVARVLSLDHDGGAWAEVVLRDRVLSAVQERYAGFRPVLFHSPYEAAAWGIIQARRGMAQANGVRRRLSEEHGAVLELAGERCWAFPLPEQLLSVRSLPGIEPLRLRRLHAVAEAALAGRLDPERLLALGPQAARDEMRRLPGIGEFYSGLITVRGTGFADALAYEPRSLAAVGHLYGLPSAPTPERFASLADTWRPFRTWAVVLLRYAGHRDGLALG